tara:strand:+ start:660 stop:878 length:219 start_codon:yes stop_codon:yes gene_type:complete
MSMGHMKAVMFIADTGQIPEVKEAIDRALLLKEEKIVLNGCEYTVNQAKGIVIIGEEYLKNRNQFSNFNKQQ